MKVEAFNIEFEASEKDSEFISAMLLLLAGQIMLIATLRAAHREVSEIVKSAHDSGSEPDEKVMAEKVKKISEMQHTLFESVPLFTKLMKAHGVSPFSDEQPTPPSPADVHSAPTSVQ